MTTYRARSAAVVMLLVLSGLAESIGLLTLLPLLQLVAEGAPADGGVERLVVGGLARLGAEPTLGGLLVVIVVALAAKGVFRWLAMRHVGNTVARVARDLRGELMEALLGARWTHVGTERAGDIATAVGRDAFWASYAYRHACAAAAAGIQVVAYAGVVVALSWRLGLVAVAGAGALALVLGVFVRMSRRAGASQTARARRLAGELLDVVAALKPIRAMGRQGSYGRLLADRAGALESAERRQVLAVESLHAFQEPLLALLLAPAVYVAVTRAGVGLPLLMMGVFLVHRLAGRAHQLQAEVQGMAAAEAAFRALRRQTLEAEAAREPAAGGVAAPALERGIELRGVTVGYGGEPVLRRLDLELPAGGITVLCGPSGAGKTTLLDVLAGLHEPSDGVVLVDGIRLGDVDRDAWRSRVGYVPQDPALLHATVAENLRLGHDLDDAALERALRRAGALGLVERLPGGLAAVVGERGARLSGGERRRLALARALAGEPRLLLLDEATSELDAATEAAIWDTLAGLRGELTIVAASHNASVRERADRVVELGGGRVRALAAS